MNQTRKASKSQQKQSKNTSKQSLINVKTPEKSGVFSLPTSETLGTEVNEGLLEDDVPLPYENYEERYIAFIDILGFKEIVRHSRNQQPSNSPWSLSSIFNALNLQFQGFTEDYEKQYGTCSSDLKVNTFSDFVVISSHATEAGLDLLIFVVWCVIRDWLSKGYLSRGGIAKGDVIHVVADNNRPGVVFGPAFIEAYNLEHEVADYPRVVFSKSVRTDLNKYRSDGENTISAVKTLVTRCEDGPMSIDTFGHLRPDGFDFLGKDHGGEALQFNRTLSEQLEHGADMPRWFRKTAWLVKQFNDAVAGTAYAHRTVQIDQA